MHTEPTPQHLWLKTFLGDWTVESEGLAPDGTVHKGEGAESVHALGDLWVVCRGRFQMGTVLGESQMTLGYDPQKQRFVGSWVGTMMANQWVYEGELDDERKVLSLACQGPSFSGDGSLSTFKDVFEVRSDDHRILTSYALQADGTWLQFMTAHYRRKPGQRP